MEITTVRATRGRWSRLVAAPWSWATIAVLAAAVLGAGLTPASGAEALRWKFKAGETLKYTMDQKTTTNMKAMGQEIKTTLNQTINLHWKVKNVSSEGVAELTQTIDRIRTKIEFPGVPFEYDSDGDKAPEGPISALLVPLLKALVGAEFSFKMNGRGDLTDIKVPPKLVEAISKAGPAAAGGGGMFSEEGMKNMITQSSLALPEAALEKGKSWSQQAKVPLPMLGTMIMDKTYTFQGADSKNPALVQIGLNTKVTLEQAADANISVKIKAQDGKGDFTFDPNAGRVVSSRVNDQLQMSISAMGQELEQATNTVTTMTLDK